MNALSPPSSRFSSAEFNRLLRAGGFGDVRVELREGMIVKMAPQFYRHGKAKRLIAEALQRAIIGAGLSLLVEQEISVAFGGDFEPLPDIIVWDPAAVDGEPDGPIPGAAVRLIVEVADTSLADDMGAKRAAYATADLAEYWVADLSAKVIHRHDAPAEERYRQASPVHFGEPAVGLTMPVTLDTTALR